MAAVVGGELNTLVMTQYERPPPQWLSLRPSAARSAPEGTANDDDHDNALGGGCSELLFRIELVPLAPAVAEVSREDLFRPIATLNLPTAPSPGTLLTASLAAATAKNPNFLERLVLPVLLPLDPALMPSLEVAVVDEGLFGATLVGSDRRPRRRHTVRHVAAPPRPGHGRCRGVNGSERAQCVDRTTTEPELPHAWLADGGRD